MNHSLNDSSQAVAGGSSEACFLSYEFKNIELLMTALTHKSFANEKAGGEKNPHNEKLEFLGDAVLQLALTEVLMENFPHAEEGLLSRLRAHLVNEDSLAELSRETGVADRLMLGRGEFKSGGHAKPRLLACAFEAVLGALFMDAGFLMARDEIRKAFASRLKDLQSQDLSLEQEFDRDYKSKLQEKVQSQYKVTPVYNLVERLGPAHEAIFKVRCVVRNEVLSEAQGRSKKVAEQLAAAQGLEVLREREKKKETES